MRASSTSPCLFLVDLRERAPEGAAETETDAAEEAADKATRNASTDQ